MYLSHCLIISTHLHENNRNPPRNVKNVAAEMAVGDSLIFFDGGFELVADWLRPLLQRFKESPHSLVAPVVMPIDPVTMGLRNMTEMEVPTYME